uniref:EF-hand domain-containing protein n=1 Tax=Oryzias sinensis TaxID=183150 RepID=A0A8C7WPB0_9TELE
MNFTDSHSTYEVADSAFHRNMPRAGKLKPKGDHVASCLQENSRSPTPPAVRRVRSSIHPGLGAVRVHRGKAGDPDVARSLIHGVSTKPSPSDQSLLNPPQKTLFQEKMLEVKESVYASRRKAPLGRSRDQPAQLPSWFDGTTIFGTKTVKGLDVREIINPSKTAEEMETDAQEGHEADVRSHKDYFVGGRINRKYDSRCFSDDCKFGIPTPHFNDGRIVGKTLKWLGETQKFYNPNPVWQRSGTKEKLALEFGKVENIKLKAPPLPTNHTFGIVVPPDYTGAGEIIHCTEPGQYTRGRDSWSGQVQALRHHLKNLNFQNFPSLMKAFQQYDKKGKEMIDKEDLKAVFREFQLDVKEAVVDQLLAYCDADKDGLLSFTEFANFLNWKDLMPLHSQKLRGQRKEHQSSPSEPAKQLLSQALIKPEDPEPVRPGSTEKPIKTLTRTSAAPDQFMTSSSLTGAVSHTSNSRTSGVPSVRSDLPAPRVKRMGDTTNYGDSSTAADLLHPSVHALRGVHEEHFLCPRSKEEISEIFRNVGVDISEETFEEAWTLASMKRPNGEMNLYWERRSLFLNSVTSIRRVMNK